MHIAEGMNELADLKPHDVRNHVGEQGVAGDVEGNAQEIVARALVQLARQLAVRDVELEQRVARAQSHLV